MTINLSTAISFMATHGRILDRRRLRITNQRNESGRTRTRTGGRAGFLDAVNETHPQARDLLDRLGQLLPASGSLHVAGGTEEETVRPLDFAPTPGRPVRNLFHPNAITADLQRLVNDQQDDGGWRVDFTNYSPAAALEWRDYQAVRAVSILQRNALI